MVAVGISGVPDFGASGLNPALAFRCEFRGSDSARTTAQLTDPQPSKPCPASETPDILVEEILKHFDVDLRFLKLQDRGRSE